MSMKIAFPQPPPTNNTLTAQERSQLLRSTKKLGRILGSTPHLIDERPRSVVPMHIDLSFKFPATKPGVSGEDALPDIVEVSRGGHSPSDSVSSSCSGDSSFDSSFDSSSISSVESTTSVEIPHINVTKPIARRPFLRLHPKRNAPASVRPTLETIPGSPSPYKLTHDITPTPPVYRISPPNSCPTSIIDSSPSPDFTIPSDASLRRAKMDRLRRRLGEGVPIEMVFGKVDESERAYYDEEIVPLTRQSSKPDPLKLKKSHTMPVSSCPSSYRSFSRKSLSAIVEIPAHAQANGRSEGGGYDTSDAPLKKSRKKRGHRRATDKDLWV